MANPSYSLVEADPEPARAQSKARSWRTRQAATASILAGILAAGATVLWLSGPGTHVWYVPSAGLESKAGLGFVSQCGKTEMGVEYVVEGGWFKQLDHIPTAEMCCAFCQGEPNCKSFSWVEDAGLVGCPSQCWLKGGMPQRRNQKPGIVSGVPPPRKAFYGAPATPAGSPSLYCFSLMVPNTGEPKLLEWQAARGVSIFSCDQAAIYSNKVMKVGPLTTVLVDSDLKCKFGGDSQSALNSWIFIAVWKALVTDGSYRSYDWSVKVDPDCVFFPDRLKRVLVNHQGEPYVNNCKYGMHGPIEVLGKKAFDALGGDYKNSFDGKTPGTCVKNLHFGQWGEDMFLDQCLSKEYHLQARVESSLMCEAHCDCPDYFWCKAESNAVSFHPFKTVDSYSNCMANALSGVPS